MDSTLRPDERAAQAQIRRAQNVKNTVTGGITAVGGAALAGKVIPFLSEYIPANLAIKGISKVAPKIGEFLSKGQSYGLTAESGLDYLRGEVGKLEQSAQEPAKKSKNIIEQESPELYSFLDQEIRKGRKPIEAGALAQNDKRFSEIIKKLMKAHKTPWSNIIESIYGAGDTALPSQQPAQQPTPQQQQAGQGIDPAVAQIMAQGEQILKGFRGQQ
jgi:hypothetical protein